MKQSKPKLRLSSSLPLLVAAFVILVVFSARAKDKASSPDTSGEGTTTAASAATGTASIPAGGKAILRESTFYYGAFNRRDPFRSLVSGKFVRDSVMESIDYRGP